MGKRLDRWVDGLLSRKPLGWLAPILRRRPESRFDFSRRAVIGSVAGGVTAAALAKIGPLAEGKTYHPALIRPPGALREDQFLTKCIQCSACMKVCPTNALQPVWFEAGWEGIWSPKLVPRIGYCEYNCNLCGQVCPTGAIEPLTVEAKKEVRMGMAVVHRDRCLPWSYDKPCIVCEEHCPTPKKAIWYDELDVVDRNGNTVHLKRPHVDLDLCIGCGICENVCPLRSEPAITVISSNETRNPNNQALLKAYDGGDGVYGGGGGGGGYGY